MGEKEDDVIFDIFIMLGKGIYPIPREYIGEIAWLANMGLYETLFIRGYMVVDE